VGAEQPHSKQRRRQHLTAQRTIRTFGYNYRLYVGAH
jgi:hypothetical protein